MSGIAITEGLLHAQDCAKYASFYTYTYISKMWLYTHTGIYSNLIISNTLLAGHTVSILYMRDPRLRQGE